MRRESISVMKLVAICTWSRTTAFLGVPLVAVCKAERGHLGRAIETGEAMYVDDMATDTLYNKLAHNSQNMLKAGFHSSFLIPLRVRGEGLGAMNFLGKERYHSSEPTFN